MLYTAAFVVLSLFGVNRNIYIIGDWRLPVVLIGFGMFLLFNSHSFENNIVNRIAQSAFAVYLITEYGMSKELLWVRLFNLKNLYQETFAIPQIFGILLAIYTSCTLLDFVRQALFTVTIDRHRGYCFELTWNKIIKPKKTPWHVGTCVYRTLSLEPLSNSACNKLKQLDCNMWYGLIFVPPL